MKFKLVFILLVAFNSGIEAQILESDSLYIIPDWKARESYKYQLEKYRYKKINEQEIEGGSTSYISFNVEEVTDSSYLIGIRIDSMKASGQNTENPLLKTFTTAIANKLNYQVETDKYGTLLGIRNWQELRKTITRLIREFNLLNSMDEAQQAQARLVFNSMTNSKTKIESLFSKEFGVLFVNYGYRFRMNDNIAYENRLANPYGGEPLVKTGKIFLDDSSIESSNSITLIDESSIDEKVGQQAVMQLLKQVTEDHEVLESQLKNIAFNIYDRVAQEYDLDNGSILTASVERKVIYNDLKSQNTQIERQDWNLIEVIVQD